jgi:hypothetical protein
MPNHETLNTDVPRFEPWLGVMGSSFVPAAASVFLPSTFLIPLIVLTVLLFGASLSMLWRQSISQRETGGQRVSQTMEAS